MMKILINSNGRRTQVDRIPDSSDKPYLSDVRGAQVKKRGSLVWKLAGKRLFELWLPRIQGE